MQVRVISPIVTKDFGPSAIQELLGAARPDNQVENTFLDRGPASIECELDEALAVPDTIARAIEGERAGANAIMINCMGDPGLKPAREAVSIPVVGPMEMASHMAASLGHKFSVVTVLERIIPMLENLIASYGLSSKLASVRSVDIPVLDLEKDRQRMVEALVEQATQAVEADGADVIVFGCTGMAGVAEAVQAGLREKGYEVPVIDPPVLALKMAEVLVDMGLSHSKRTYPNPPQKLILGHECVSSLLG